MSTPILTQYQITKSVISAPNSRGTSALIAFFKEKYDRRKYLCNLMESFYYYIEAIELTLCDANRSWDDFYTKRTL